MHFAFCIGLSKVNLGLLSAIYGTALKCRRFAYRISLKKPGKLPAKVICIGNLTLGGTGKTPAVISVAQEAKKRGFKPCILTRGYRGTAKSPCFVSKGKGPLLDAIQAGDEPVLMSSRLDGVPVIKGKNRFLSGMYALRELGSDAVNMFILDDGFQHWSLYRDIDVVLIDASNPFGNGKLFPEGILREPLSALSRADTVVITKTNTSCSKSIKTIEIEIKRHYSKTGLFTSVHKPALLINVSGELKDIESLNNATVYAFAGIANPSHFKAMLASNEANIEQFKAFKDHYIYKQYDIDRIVKDASGLRIITTEKDLMRLKDLKLPENLYTLRIDFSVDKEFYDIIFK